MKPFFLIFIVALLACSNAQHKTSYWQTMKDSFPMKNVSTFICDSALLSQYMNFPKIKNTLFDSTFPKQEIYLYSWQERDPGKTEFTVFLNRLGEEPMILYYILDKEDHFISRSLVADRMKTSRNFTEIRSRLMGRDTLVTWIGITSIDKQNWFRGDTTSYFYLIGKDGRVGREPFRKHP